MERVENGTRVNFVPWLMFGLVTCGLGFLAMKMFTKQQYALWCRRCDTTQPEPE